MDGVSIYPLLQGKEMVREKPLSFWFYSRSQTDKIHRQHSAGAGPRGPKGAESKHLDNPDVIPAANPGWTAIIDGKWKLHQIPGAKKEAPTQLYDIHTDPGETNNIAAQHPEVVKELDKKLTAWRDSVVTSTKGEDYNVQPEIVFEDQQRD